MPLAGAFGKEIRWVFLRRDGPDFQKSLNPALHKTSLQVSYIALLNKSPNEAAVAAHPITQPSVRPRDRAGFQPGLVTPTHISIIKCCVRHLACHARGYHPSSSLGISCCSRHESLLSLSTPAIYYKFLLSQEESLGFTPHQDESLKGTHLP